MRGNYHKPDEIDELAIAWARQRRIALGIILPENIEPYERIGQLRSTLAKVRTNDHEKETSALPQHWPEVYSGMTMTVHRAYAAMSGEERMVMHLHYVWREIPVPVKAPEVPCTLPQFWTILSRVKGFLKGYISSNTTQQRVQMA